MALHPVSVPGPVVAGPWLVLREPALVWRRSPARVGRAGAGRLLSRVSVCPVSPGLTIKPSRNTVWLEPPRATRREATCTPAPGNAPKAHASGALLFLVGAGGAGRVPELPARVGPAR